MKIKLHSSLRILPDSKKGFRYSPHLLIAIAFIVPTTLQTYSQTKFEKTYGTVAKNEYGREAAVISNNQGYVITGYANRSANNKDIYFLKLDTCGRLKISRTYGGTQDDLGYSVSELNGGNFAIAGESSSYGSGQSDAYLLKMQGASFGTVNGRAIGDTLIDVAQDFKQVSGSYIVTGYTQKSNGTYDVLLTKFNNTLTAQWEYKIGGNRDDFGYAVQVLSSGDYIIAGGTKSYGAGNLDAYLIKTNSNGIVTWAKAYGNAQLDVAYNVKQTLDGGFILVGKTRNANATGNSQDDILLIKTNFSGTLQWAKAYGGTQDETGEDVVQVSDSGYVVAGYTKSYGNGNWDVYLFKVDKNGNTVWARTSGGSGEDKAYSIDKTNDNGFFITGHSNSFGPGLFDVYALKTNSLGSTGCNDSAAISTFLPNDTTENGFIQDTLLHIVNGAAADSLATLDTTHCTTCNPPVKGLLESSSEAALVMYPNPANENITIDITNENQKPAEIIVYNSLGIQVYRLENIGVENRVYLDTKGWPTGLYFVKVMLENTVLSGELIIVR